MTETVDEDKLSPFNELAATGPSPFKHLKNPGQRSFLIAYATVGMITRADAASGVSYGSHHKWMKEDPEYKEAFALAQEMAGDYAERVAYERAIKGVMKAVYYQGEIVGYDVVYSDGLLKFILKGAKPTKYRDNIDITSQGQELRIIIDDGQPVLLLPPQPLAIAGAPDRDDEDED